MTILSRFVISNQTFVTCGHRPQHLRYQREAIFGQRPPQFIVAKGHNTWKVTKLGQYDHQQHSVLGNLLYTHLAGYSYGDHIVSICYSKPNIHGQRPQLVVAWPLNLRGHREVICGLKIPEIIVAEGHSI